MYQAPNRDLFGAVLLDADTATDPANLTAANTFADNAGDDICGP